jgi:hypothetical protein
MFARKLVCSTTKMWAAACRLSRGQQPVLPQRTQSNIELAVRGEVVNKRSIFWRINQSYALLPLVFSFAPFASFAVKSDWLNAECFLI